MPLDATTTLPSDITQTKPNVRNLTTTIPSPEILESVSTTTITIGVMGGFIAILVLIVSVVVPCLIQQQRKLKSITTDHNSVYDGN